MLEGGGITRVITSPVSEIAATSSIFNYHHTQQHKIPPAKQEGVDVSTKQPQPAPANKQMANERAKAPVGVRSGSTIVLISTKISNPTVATQQGALIKTTGTLYNMPRLVDDHRHLPVAPETSAACEDEGGVAATAQQTSKTATILVSKHKTKTGLPLMLKKSKK